MLCLDTDGLIHLTHGAMACLAEAEGLVVGCRGGALWITLERDDRDIVLTAGERFTVDRGGLTVICAIGGPADATIGPDGGRRLALPAEADGSGGLALAA